MKRMLPSERLRGATDAECGLPSSEVAARRAAYGANDVLDEPRGGWRAQVIETARDPMLWFLVIVGGLHAVLGEITEAAVLLISIVPLVAMDAVLHRRTEASTRALQSRLAVTASVLRDGEVREVASRDLVAGDLVLVHAGEAFAADGVIVVGTAMQVDESALTGEALPVRKRAIVALPSAGEPTIPEEHWAAAGTRLLTGSARMRVVFTGAETRYGEIVRSARPSARARTPLQQAISRLVGVLLVIALGLCLVLAWVRLRQGFGVLDALTSAATLAVAAIPEEFPIVFTFFLGVGVYRLARRKALVRRAVVVENIGRITCICTDKTGTLTEGRLSVAHRYPVEGSTPERLLEIASVASRAESGDPLDDAILAASGSGEVAKIERFAFTEDRRRETAIVELGDGRLAAAVKGAPEVVLAMCDLDRAGIERWRALVSQLAAAGHKVIACAEQELSAADWDGTEPDRGYRFAGLIACEDALRAGVAEAIAATRAAGIRVIMVTGDHPATAEAIARELGLGGERPIVVSADQLEAEGERRVLRADVVARAIPSQKLALVRALQAAGEVVAVTGDGVNDVPALQAADVGIAMGERGTRSAREIGSIVLLDDDFGTIVRAIAEGQQLFRNLQLSFAYLVMVHIPLVSTAALIPLAGFPLLYLPIHVVWLELIIHPTALLVFQESPPTDHLRALSRPRRVRFFDAASWALIAFVSVAVTAAMLWGYQRALGGGHVEHALSGGHVEHARAFALVTLIAASATMTAGLSALGSRTARVVALATLASAVVIIQTPLARVLHVEPLHADDWLLAGLVGIVPALAGIILRRRFASFARAAAPGVDRARRLRVDDARGA